MMHGCDAEFTHEQFALPSSSQMSLLVCRCGLTDAMMMTCVAGWCCGGQLVKSMADVLLPPSPLPPPASVGAWYRIFL
jgi:hypothetical protein